MKPYFELNETIKNIILELYKKCTDINLGNLSFWYDDMDCSMAEYIDCWRLSVYHRQAKIADIYKIVNGIIVYEYSEKD